MAVEATVDAIVVNYRSSHYLARLLESLATEPVRRVVIWDNFSTDEERDELVRLEREFPRLLVHFAEQNLGFGPGVNAAVQTLSAQERPDFLWILNPDVIVQQGALNRLVRTASAEEVGILSPLILSPGGDRIWYAGGFIDGKGGRSVHANIGRPRSVVAATYERAGFVSGAAPLIDMRVWGKLGGFDESLFLYCEDADLSIRATHSGVTQGVERRAVVLHAEGGSSTGGTGPGPMFYFYVQRNRFRVYRGFTTPLGLVIGRGLPETLRLLILPWRPLNRGSWSRFRASLGGLVAGLRQETHE